MSRLKGNCNRFGVSFQTKDDRFCCSNVMISSGDANLPVNITTPFMTRAGVDVTPYLGFACRTAGPKNLNSHKLLHPQKLNDPHEILSNLLNSASQRTYEILEGETSTKQSIG
jgi:hypothetical protein